MTLTPYDTNLISVYNAIKSGKPFINNLGTPIKDITGLSDEVVGVITNIMDNYIATGGLIGDSTWIKLNDIVSVLDAPYLGSGSYAQPTVFDNMYPPLKHLLSNNADISAVVQGMGIPLPGLLNHTNTITESLPNILSAIGVKNQFDLKYFNAAETCLAYTGIMGSLLGTAQEILNTINEILNKIINLALLGLSVLLSSIALLLKPLYDAIKNIYNMIIKENEALKDLYKFLEDYALAALLAVVRDPCVKAVVDAVGSPKLKNAVNNLRKVDSLDDFIPLVLQESSRRQ